MKIIGLVCIFVFVKESDDLWIYALCLSLTAVLSNLIMWPSMLKQIIFVKFSDLNIRKRVVPSILIFLPTLAVTVYSVLDKTMIGLLSSNPDYDNGCYEQAYKINSMALILITVISPVMIPRNTYDYSHGNIDKLLDSGNVMQGLLGSDIHNSISPFLKAYFGGIKYSPHNFHAASLLPEKPCTAFFLLLRNFAHL